MGEVAKAIPGLGRGRHPQWQNRPGGDRTARPRVGTTVLQVRFHRVRSLYGTGTLSLEGLCVVRGGLTGATGRRSQRRGTAWQRRTNGLREPPGWDGDATNVLRVCPGCAEDAT